MRSSYFFGSLTLAFALVEPSAFGSSLAGGDLSALEALLSGEVSGVEPPAAPAATSARRDARLWLDDDYWITPPTLGGFADEEEPDWWQEWVAAVSLTPSFLSAFTGAAWAGGIEQTDFESPIFDSLS